MHTVFRCSIILPLVHKVDACLHERGGNEEYCGGVEEKALHPWFFGGIGEAVCGIRNCVVALMEDGWHFVKEY